MLAWRNQSANREVSNNQHVISLDEHLAWWSKVQEDATRRVLVFEVDGKPRGVVNFFDLSLDQSPRTGSWGFFLDNETASAEGTAMLLWTKVMGEALDFAFDTLDLDVLEAEVLEHNEAVRAMNRRYRFTEGTPEEREVDGRTIKVIPISLRRQDRRRPRRSK
jgi:RimJ/RimL family protein N-acetyltransferase